MWEKILHPFVLAVVWVWAKIHDFLVLIGMGAGSGFAWVFSIVLLTILVRILIVPLYLKQIKSMRGMQAIQPEMQRIQQKYKGKKDPVSRRKMAEETQALYKKYGTNPLASCLPLLVQMPILFALYRAIFAVKPLMEGTYTIGGQPYEALGPITRQIAQEIDQSTVFGVPLSHTIRDGDGAVGVAAFVVCIIIMVVTMFIQMRWSMTKNMPPAVDPNNPMVKSQKTMMYAMPAMYIFTGVAFQMGLIVYMMTTTIWSALQQLWVIKVLPTPGAPAYQELLDKRSDAYHQWAKPYFEQYDQRRQDLDDDAAIDELNERTLTEVQSKAKRQRVNSDFPTSMSVAQKVSIYRNLAMQEWNTLPDEQWMMGVKRATERVQDRQKQLQVRRDQPKKLTRSQRKEEAEREAQLSAEQQAAEEKKARRERNKVASNLTPEEIERRRQARQAAKRKRNKK